MELFVCHRINRFEQKANSSSEQCLLSLIKSELCSVRRHRGASAASQLKKANLIERSSKKKKKKETPFERCEWVIDFV